MMNDDTLEKYRRAGRIARDALRFARDIVLSKKRLSLYDLAERIEGFVLRKGGKLAFPCNISVNNVAAHYTPLTPMDGEIGTDGIIKIDVGVHIDGYIADTAISLSTSKRYADMLKVNKRILENVLDMLRPGVRTGKLGEYVEDTAKAHGYKPISNLSGHLIDKYSLHAGKHIPNVKQFISPTVRVGEVYAVEPFLTFKDGAGSVEEMKDSIRIFSLAKLKKEKDPEMEAVRSYILKNYNRLPFTPRWLYSTFKDDSIDLVKRLYNRRVVKGYPVLIEKKGREVSQFEHTVIVFEGDNIVITK